MKLIIDLDKKPMQLRVKIKKVKRGGGESYRYGFMLETYGLSSGVSLEVYSLNDIFEMFDLPTLLENDERLVCEYAVDVYDDNNEGYIYIRDKQLHDKFLAVAGHQNGFDSSATTPKGLVNNAHNYFESKQCNSERHID